MEKEFRDTKNFVQAISDVLHQFAIDYFPDTWQLSMQIFLKVALLLLLIFATNYVINYILKGLVYLLPNKLSKKALVVSMVENKISNSISNFFALSFSSTFIGSIFYRHAVTPTFLDKLINILILFAVFILSKRILESISKYYNLKKDNYRVTALRAITQTATLIGYLIFGTILIMLIFGISSTAILGTLGALTAVILLIFRDTILGFVTGIHVSVSRLVKTGDWIYIQKYNIEGHILEINLLTTQMLNFDKSVSTFPTYDLLSTEVKNMQVMYDGNIRRLQRSIVMDVSSFIFIDDDFYAQLSKINLIQDYMNLKQVVLENERSAIPNSDLIINGHQLTNIGVFRKYVLAYLNANPNIDKDELLIVRQLEVSAQGMPLEIMCFTKTSDITEFENIQADIFDHLLAAAKIFKLEILQFSKPKI